MGSDAPNPPETATPGDRLDRIEKALALLSQMAEQQGKAAPQHEKVEPIILVLLGATMALVVILVTVSKWSPNDAQTFQVIAGLATGFGGAVLARIKPADQKKSGDITSTGGGVVNQ